MKRNFYFLLFLLNISANNCFAGNDKLDLIVDCVKKYSEKFGDTLGSIAGIAGVVTIAKFGKEVIVETKEYFRPGHERQLKNTTQEMNKCLFDFKQDDKDEFGLARKCRPLVDNYERLAGPKALDNLRKAYAK